MVLADVRVLRASLSHITSSSIYLVIIVNKYGGLLVKTKTVMLLLFVLLWQASGICMNCLFLMFLIFRLSYLQYSYRFATAFVEIYLEYLSFAFEWNRYSLMGRLILAIIKSLQCVIRNMSQQLFLPVLPDTNSTSWPAIRGVRFS